MLRILTALFALSILCQIPASAQTVKTMQIETVRTESFTMDYLRFGNGKKPLVIIPGLSVQSVMKFSGAVAESYKLLADDFTVYLFERRNELPSSYSVYDMSRDTAEAIRALKLGGVCLFGVSQGGMIAMKIAADNPGLVRSLILGSTSAHVTRTQFSVIDEWIQFAKAGNAEGLYLSFGEKLYPESVFEQSRKLLIDSAKTVTPEELTRFVILAEATKDFDAADDLKKIACPVLVIGSKDDKVLGGEASEKIFESLKDKPGCELFMYDGYGHAAYDTAPDYRERMLKFFLSH
ncbi:MAG: alpha/beta hydrolase [Synergistaceae bacterium]|nr:alpha/beta hydrolase [Synergistaceae bacterium]